MQYDITVNTFDRSPFYFLVIHLTFYITCRILLFTSDKNCHDDGSFSGDGDNEQRTHYS